MLTPLLATSTLGSITDMSIPGLAIIAGVIIVSVITISDAIRKSSQTRQREESRREIAAYVAEGSMTPEEGERLIAAGRKHGVGNNA